MQLGECVCFCGWFLGGTDFISTGYQPYWLLIVVFLFLKAPELHFTRHPTGTWIAAFAISPGSSQSILWGLTTTRCHPDVPMERNANISLSVLPNPGLPIASKSNEVCAVPSLLGWERCASPTLLAAFEISHDMLTAFGFSVSSSNCRSIQ